MALGPSTGTLKAVGFCIKNLQLQDSIGLHESSIVEVIQLLNRRAGMRF